MADVTWIKGTIDPPESGAYYVVLEAKHDMIDPMTGKVYYKTGDVIINVDCYNAEHSFWEQPGKDNPFWKVVCWANILKPDIPDGVRERLVEYFGTKVKWQNGHWCVEEGKNNGSTESKIFSDV